MLDTSWVTIHEAAILSGFPVLFLRRATAHSESVGGLPVPGWCTFCRLELFWPGQIEYWTESGFGLRSFREFNRTQTLEKFLKRQQLARSPSYLRASDIVNYHASDPVRGTDALKLMVDGLKCSEFSDGGCRKVLMLSAFFRAVQWTKRRSSKPNAEVLLVSKESIIGWLDDQFGEAHQKDRLTEMWVQRAAYLAWTKNHHLKPNSIWIDQEFDKISSPPKISYDEARARYDRRRQILADTLPTRHQDQEWAKKERIPREWVRDFRSKYPGNVRGRPGQTKSGKK